MVALLVALGLVLVLLVAADRVAPRLVGDRIGSTLQTVLGTPARPVVRIGGVPFLTQVATRHFRHISITARDVPVPGNGGRLTIAELDAGLSDVRAAAGYRRLTVGRFAGSATIGYATLSEAAGAPVTYDAEGDGQLTMNLGGAITVTGRPAIDRRTEEIYLGQPRFRIGGRLLPGALPQGVLTRLLRVPVPDLVPGIALDDVRAEPEGLTLAASGTDVRLGR
ncbi:DUF2993 domain-containing protein [Microlunatus sp. Gsoil 973]|uniref:LmeA family phospholipid-binding protein n=1 Tax=Microlunatus sp. Gsoil 973 TaxID=2672569 RepID=UPI0018A808A0|nr:DUF2993 domain-containing protein [Microlunatus sp. Gsoil 973]